MTPQQIVGVAVRLFAIWLVITAIQAASTGLGTSAQPGTQSTIAPDVLSALFIVVAILLWLFPPDVAYRLVLRTKVDKWLDVPTQEALVVACVIHGRRGW